MVINRIAETMLKAFFVVIPYNLHVQESKNLTIGIQTFARL